MFRVEMEHRLNAVIMRVEGQLCGEYAEHLRSLITRSNEQKRLIVDINDVTWVDALGEEVLSFIRRLGIEFIAEDAYSRHVCERLQLSLVSSLDSVDAIDGRKARKGKNS